LKSFIKFTSNPYDQYKEHERLLKKNYINLADRGIFDQTHYGVFKGTPKSNKQALRSNYSNKHSTLFNKLVNLSMVAGLKQQSFLTLSRVFSKFIYVLKFEQDAAKIKYMASRYLDFILVQNIKSKSSTTANDFLYELVTDITPLFTLKTQKTKIKKRSKKKQKYKVRIAYVKPKSRNLVALKWIISGAQWFSAKNWETKLFKALLNVFLGGSNSYLQQKKIKIYKQMVKTFKSKK